MKTYNIFEVSDYKGGELHTYINLTYEQYLEWLLDNIVLGFTLKEKKNLQFQDRCEYASYGTVCFSVFVNENNTLTQLTKPEDDDYSFLTQEDLDNLKLLTKNDNNN